MHLLVEVAGQEAQPLARLHGRPGEHDARDLALHERRHRHRHRQERLAGAGGADREDHVVAADGVDVALLPERLGRDQLLAGRHRDGVAEHRLEVGLGVGGDHAHRRPHLAAADRRPRAQQLGQLGDRALGPAHLALVALEHDVVAAGHDAHVQLGLEGAEVVVVAAEQLAQIDVGGERQAAGGRGGRLAQRLSLTGPESTMRVAALTGGAPPPAGRRGCAARAAARASPGRAPAS